MPRLTLAPKIFAAIVVVALSTIVVGIVAFTSLNRIAQAKIELEAADTRSQRASDALSGFLAYALALEQIARTSSLEETRLREQRADREHAGARKWIDNLEVLARTDEEKAEVAEAGNSLMSLRATQGTVQTLTHVGDVKAAEALLGEQEPRVFAGKEKLRSVQARNATLAHNAMELVNTEQTKAKDQITFVSILGIAIALLMAFGIVTTQVTNPLAALSNAVQKLAGGDTDIQLPKAKGRDEIANMVRCVATFRENAIRINSMAAEEQTRKAATEAERHALMRSLADDFERAVSTVISGTRAAAEKLTMAAVALESTATESSQQAVAVSQAAQEASMNVSTVATAAEQLNSSVTEVGRQVAQSNAIAERATNEAHRTTENVHAQSEAARRIGDVVDMINTLAAQTNLLALNATIEAARAGEAGRGFAVVAAEVKSLAEQTARATGQIAEQVKDIRATTEASSLSIGEIVSTVGSMAGISSAIAAAIEEQRASTEEIARNVREASRGTDEVSITIEQVSGASIRTGDAAGEVRSLAETIVAQANTLRNSVDHFLVSVRNDEKRAA